MRGAETPGAAKEVAAEIRPAVAAEGSHPRSSGAGATGWHATSQRRFAVEQPAELVVSEGHAKRLLYAIRRVATFLYNPVISWSG